MVVCCIKVNNYPFWQNFVFMSCAKILIAQFIGGFYMKLKNIGLLSTLAAGLLVACSSGSSSSGSGIQYATLNYSGTLPSGGIVGLTGIRQVGSSSSVYITGSYAIESFNHGTLYVGPVTGGGTYYVYDYPSSLNESPTAGTNVYSADNGLNGNVQLTGTYTVESSSTQFGFYYNGPVSNTQSSSNWQTLMFPSAQDPDNSTVLSTVPHSIMGGLIVGNYISLATAGNAFIYDVETESYQRVSYPGSRYTSLYGIWSNGGESYTVAGGYGNGSPDIKENAPGTYAFVADYNRVTKTFSNWTSYTYNNQPSAVAHFEGITSDGNGGYNLAGSGLANGNLYVSLINVKRNSNGTFNPTSVWTNVWYPGSSVTTSDTVYQNYLLGVYQESGVSGQFGYVATIPGAYYGN